jgi:hypothetical protein
MVRQITGHLRTNQFPLGRYGPGDLLPAVCEVGLSRTG